MLVIGYVLEKCEFGKDDWKPVPGYIPKTEFTVRGLEPEKRYVFRIQAGRRIFFQLFLTTANSSLQ